MGNSGSYVGPLLGHFRAMLGLCCVIWALLAAFGPKKKTTENFSVVFFFGVGFGLMLGHLEVMLGLCWAILGLCWAFVGSFGVLLAAFGPKKIPPTENFSVGGNFGVGFGLMLGLLEVMLGLCWAILGLCWAFVGSFGVLLAAFGPKKKNPTEAWFGRGFFWGRFWAYVGPFGGYVGPLLGLCWAILRLCWTLLGLSGLKIQPQPKHGSVGVEFWAGFGLMLGHLLSRSRAMKRVRLSVLWGKSDFIN